MDRSESGCAGAARKPGICKHDVFVCIKAVDPPVNTVTCLHAGSELRHRVSW